MNDSIIPMKPAPLRSEYEAEAYVSNAGDLRVAIAASPDSIYLSGQVRHAGGTWVAHPHDYQGRDYATVAEARADVEACAHTIVR